MKKISASVSRLPRRALSASLLNQVVSSGTSLALGLVLVRQMTAVEYGLYGIGIAALLFFAGIGTALFITQLLVYYPDQRIDERSSYSAAMLGILLFFCAASFVIACSVILVASLATSTAREYMEMSLATAFSACSYLARDFFVRYAYIVTRERIALYVNAVVATAVLGGILLFAAPREGALRASEALWIFGVSNALGAATGGALTRLPLLSVRTIDLVSGARRIFSTGLWAGGVAVASAIRGQAIVAFIAALHGPVGVAAFNLGRLLVSPAHFAFPVINQVIVPRLGALRAHSPSEMLRMSISSVILLVAITSSYSICLLLGFDLLADILVSEKYERNDIFWISSGLCLHVVALSLRSGPEAILQVGRSFDVLAMTNVLVGIPALLFAYFALERWGVIGGVYTLPISELVTTIALLPSAVSVYRAAIGQRTAQNLKSRAGN